MDMTIPNHHAEHGTLRGVRGGLVAASLLLGRAEDAAYACRLASVGPGDHVVDVGCGPGAAARAALARGARVTGVDPAPVMLRLARRATRRTGATWREGAAESLPLADASATVLWSIATIHHWNDIEAGLAEARRVLTPRGRFVGVERLVAADARGLASHGWRPEQAEAFAALLQAAGFEQVAVGRHAGRRRSLLFVVGTRR